MSKRMMLLTLFAISTSMFVLPAVATATPNHLDTIPPNGFTVHGPEGKLSATDGSTIICTTLTGNGKFTSTTTGTISLTWDHCRTTVLGTTVTCTSTNPAEPVGSIATTLDLVFHLITIDSPHAGNGILITPPAGGTQFMHFTCAGIQITIEGNGLIGTITSPACNVASNTATLSFQRNATIQHGHQTHLIWTGVKYDWTKGGSTAALEQHATMTYTGGHMPKLVCT